MAADGNDRDFLEKAASALEWPKLLALAEAQARTEPGKKLIRDLTLPENWAPNIEVARRYQTETAEISRLLDRDGLWGPLTDLSDPIEILERLGRGSVLDVSELARVRQWLFAMESWVETPREEIRGEIFKKALGTIPDPLLPLRAIGNVLTPEGELSERASPKLGALNSEIRSLKKEISSILDHLIKTFQQKGILQENFSDVRDGRFVLPIKISSQNEVEGIIYEASASGQTVFVEPKEVGQLNNRLRQRQNDLLQEIYRILSEVSDRLRPAVPEIQIGIQVIAHFDAVQAKARLSLHYSGKSITIGDTREFVLKTTAHPLLWQNLPNESIIRNDIELDSRVNTILITGPNTGGKTVFLKTLGMAGICARTGFPFPATETPIVPFFDSFFADLGDTQSIERHISTFSGHVLTFKQILENVGGSSLVLLDELNTATDPEEGAALGRAFLETLMGKGALVVATTHDPHLKALALSDERILNSSMEFSESTRAPTYRLVLGVPGRSRALETAERLGIPKPVLDLAKSYLSKEHVQFETLLSKLETDAQEAQKARRHAEALKEEAEKLKKEWTEKSETSLGEVLDRTRQRLRKILEQAQDEVRSAVRKLDEARSRKELDSTRANLNEVFSVSAARVESALEEEAPEIAEIISKSAAAKAPTPAPAKSEKLQPGEMVRIPKWKNTATVIEDLGSKVKVAMGALQMTVTRADLEPLSELEKKAVRSMQPKTAPGKKSGGGESVPAPDSRIDLRGKRFDEAMMELERYLDLAFRSGAYQEITIVHGLGTGALREGARDILKNLPYVKEFRDGGAGQGGTGATIVEFDR